MRDRIGHGYDAINVNVVWNTAKNDIKVLHIYVKEILADNFETKTK